VKFEILFRKLDLTFLKKYFTVYNELSVFLTGMSLILLLLFNHAFQSLMTSHFIKEINIYKFLFIILIIVYLGISFRHVFIKKEKTKAEKVRMLALVMLCNIASSGAVGIHVIKHSFMSSLLIFPILNLLNGFIVFSLWIGEEIDDSYIKNYDVDKEFLVGSFILLLIIFTLCQLVFKLHWSFIFSICIAFAVNIGGVVEKFESKNL